MKAQGHMVVRRKAKNGEPGKDTNLLPWVEDYDKNKTLIGGEYIISPKMFSGTNSGTSDNPILTGVAMGRECLTDIDGNKRTGIFALVDNELVFELDPINKKYKFTGEVETSKDGQRIVISPENKDIKIFDKNNKNVITLEGNEYKDIDELYSNTIPTATIKNIPVIYPKNVIIKYSKDITSAFYNSGYTVANMVISGLFQAGFSKRHSVEVRAKIYSDENLQNLESDILLDFYSNDRSFDDFVLDVNYPMGKGYHVIYIILETTRNYITDGETFRINDIDLSFILNEYISKLFANGIVFGTSSANMFTFLNRKDANGGNTMIGLISNGLAGIELKWDRMLVEKGGRNGMISPVLCCGWVTVDPDRATFQQLRTWDNTSLSIRRAGTGYVIITFDESWRGIVNYSTSYVMLTGIGSSVGAEMPQNSAIKATFYSWVGNGFSVVVSDDSTNNDGAFYFEVKLF